MLTVPIEAVAGPVGQAVALVLAQNPAPPPDKGPEFGKASPIGLVVILLLGVATVLLIRNMTKRIRRLPTSFGTQAGRARTAGPEAAGTDAPAPTDPADDPPAAGPAPPRPTDTPAER